MHSCPRPFRPALSLALLGLSLVASTLQAQDPPIGITEVGNFDAANNYADVWGDGNFAYLARFGSNRVDIVDISNPANPVLATTYNTGVGGASAQDVKTGDGLMFVGLEGVSPGAQIVDVRNPFNPVKLTDVTVRSAIHNLFYADGWLYLVDSFQPQIDIIDLRAYDPDNAPSVISSSTWRVTGVGSFVHDITAQGDRLYASGWSDLYVYDISNLANQAPVLLDTAPGNSVHAAWGTDDGQFVVVGEERTGGGIMLFEAVPDGSGIDLIPRDSFTLSSDFASSTHNQLLVGDRIYVSWYEAGVQVFEIDRETKTFFRVASFDTTSLTGNNSLFGGCWGVYPFLGEDKVLASDRDNGLFILDVDPQLLRISYPGGRPEVAKPNTPEPVDIQITEIGSAVDPSTVTLDAIVDGLPDPPLTMNDLGAGLFSADLPAAACGSVVEFSVSATNLAGFTFRDPNDPAANNRVDVAESVTTVFADDFQSDTGWVVTNTDLDTGAWERGNPIGTGPQPEDDFSGDAGGFCFFTDQGPQGGGVGDADVDGGPTRLTSPVMDFSAGNGAIRYAYWFSNDDGDDSLVVEISNDMGGNWIEANRYTGGNGGWVEDAVIVGDWVNPNSTIAIRFSVSDNPNDSVTEAAIDWVRAEVFNCVPGAGVALDVSDVVRGGTTTLTATDALSGEEVTFAATVVGPGVGPCPPLLGGLCVDIVSPVLLGSSIANGSGTATLDVSIPGSVNADTVWFQAVVPRGAGGEDSIKSNTVERPVTD